MTEESQSLDAVSGIGGQADSAARLLERLAEKLGGKASVRRAFGDPISAEGVTIVPVARTGFGFGGGSGGESSAEKVGAGGGGGGGAEVRPLGYIELRDGAAVYRPIRDPWVDVALPVAALLIGAAAPRMVRAWVRLHRKRFR
ncbi:spore germination protein GerW family protein [Nocardia sp. NPDC059180]|uniref:spore germination protein GerW family protein n=1 Tax=Nocardia sp. NPDC059180 TaxID=3346761 RepID=UPI0036823C8A